VVVKSWGEYAGYVRVLATNCVDIPEGVSFAQATVVSRHFPFAFNEASPVGVQKGD
jgi:NADPH:quinone reductase-like Zn-dependent oxidoreductase